MPRVSVVIPTYNRAHLLPESIESVLSQGYSDIEIVVVDDGSTDNTEEVVRGYGERVRYIRQRNSGASVARNLGMLYCTGDYLMLLDSDDVLLPTALTKLSAALGANPECGAAYCGWVETDSPGRISQEPSLDRPSGGVLAEMCTQYMCIVHSVMFRRECLASVGLFDPNLRMYEDMDFNVRLAARYQFVFVPERLVEYRLWHSQASRDTRDLRTQRELYLAGIEAYHAAGRLTREHVRAARHLICGATRGERCTTEAIAAFRAGDWREAWTNAVRGFALNPRSILRRTLWMIALKSLVRSLLPGVSRSQPTAARARKTSQGGQAK